MEVSIGDFGRMIFEMMTEDKRMPNFEKHIPDHWASIADEAKPLVEQLLALNEKMPNGGYDIVGHNQTMTQMERIEKAQIKLLGIPAKEVKPGEGVWKINDNGPLEGQYPFEDGPNAIMDHENDGTIYFSTRIWSEDVMIPTSGNEIVIREPDDYEDDPGKYATAKFWLKEAEKLGI